jgi:molecular chaperone DnaK (HSP70)
VAQVDEYDKAVVLQNFEGKTTTPSVVFIDGGNVIVGEEAKNAGVDEPEKTVAFIKREIGVDASFSKPTRFPSGLDPVEISSLILQKIVKDANGVTESPDPIKNVVITCPAYFGTKEREQTRQAGQIAGLNVLGIINEPTAAAIAYGIKTKERKLILVYDLGGGTFDITLIRVDGGTIKVLATGGDHKLGGKDWDSALAEYMLDVYNAEHGTDYTLDSDAKLHNLLINEAEAKKKTLSAKSKVMATVSFNGLSSRVEITRELFDQLTESLLIQTIDKVNDILKIAKTKGVAKADINEVLLVGGSSRMPQVKEKVDAELGVSSRIEDPDQCVAKGAAIFALNKNIQIEEEKFDEGDRDTKPKGLKGENNIRTQNVTSKTYGVGIVDDDNNDLVSNILFANTSLPCRVEDNYITSVNGQTSLRLPVFESDVTDKVKDKEIKPEFAVKLDEATTKFRAPHPKGDPIKVTFDVNDEGILTIYSEVKGEETLVFDVKITGVRTEEEINETAARIARMKVE